MKRTAIIFMILHGIILVACGGQNGLNPIATWTPIQARITPSITSTPDPCAAANLPDTIKPVNDLMREFDDASQLGSNVTKEQAPQVVSEMQRIRRNVEDIKVPSCLDVLKEHELAHMNSVIDTMLGFISGADGNTINQSLVKARNEHDQYTLELARLLAYPTKNSTPPPKKP